MKISNAIIYLFLLSPNLTHAAAIWPTLNDDWVAVTINKGAGYYGDISQDESPTSVDMVGNDTTPMLFWHYQDNGTVDQSDDQIQFRLRIDDEANNPQYAWQIVFDTDTDAGIDYVLELDYSGNPDKICFTSTIIGGEGIDETIADVTFDTGNPIWTTENVIAYSRFITTGDGINLGKAGSEDFYVDIAMDWNTFSTATNIGLTDTFRFGASTSATDQSINKDVPQGLDPSDPVASIFGDSVVPLPEPSSVSLLALGFCGLAMRRKR